jgi:TatA/E family protein of Tat protein translocase
MGPLGVPEMIFIFLLALVLFGPKKLPELGRTLGKALTEFRRAQSDLKSSFEREMQNLERETSGSLREVTSSVTDLAKQMVYDPNFNDDDPHYTPGYTPNVVHYSPATETPSTVGASAVPGAESNGTTPTAHEDAASEPAHHESASTTAVAALPPVEGTVPRSESTEPAQQHS